MNRDMKFYFIGKEHQDTIWNEDTLDVITTMVNASPYLADEDSGFDQR